MSYPPSAATLCAEQARERWVCPMCGGLNRAERDPGERAHEDFPALGWCQHDMCVDRRAVARTHGVIVWPELVLVLHVWAFEGRSFLEAA